MAIHNLNRVIGLSLAVSLAMTTQAEAAATTLGAVLTNVTTSFSSIPGLLSGVAYVLGILFAATGIFKFKDHVDLPERNPLSAGVKRFLAGGMLFSLPFMSTAVSGNLMGNGGTMVAFGSDHAAATGGGMDQMITTFVSNIATPASYLVEAFAWIGAILLLITGIVRLTHTAQEGARGPAGLGTILTFLSSGALFSFGDMIGTFSSSLFGSSTVSTYANISSTVLDATSAAQVAPVIEAVMTFIMIVGFIAFLRGWFVLKAFGDGTANHTLAEALTFLLGGAMAINLGALVNVLETTVGVNAITFS